MKFWMHFGAWLLLSASVAFSQEGESEAGRLLTKIQGLREEWYREKNPSLRHALGLEVVAAVEQLRGLWRQETDPARRDQLGEKVVDVAVSTLPGKFGDSEEAYDKEDARRVEIVDEVASDGKLATTEIAVPRAVADVPLKVLYSFGKLSEPVHEGETVVIRRITDDAFEVWTPIRGWLFNGKGQLLNQAHPPRRDGHGREWYGAFLPDGRWVTTDLWERDDTLTLFSRRGKWLREWPSRKLLPLAPDVVERLTRAGLLKEVQSERGDLLGWARSDKEGKGWVVSVGSDGGRGRVWVDPQGGVRELSRFEPWKLCFPRALGPRGYYISLAVPNDQVNRLLHLGSAGHGSGVGFPSFSLSIIANDAGAEKVNSGDDWPAGESIGSVRIAGGREFGFWPRSSSSYICAEPMTKKDDFWRAWFFNEKLRFQCSVRARRFADAGDGRSMLFRLPDQSVFPLSPDFAVGKRSRFVWKGGTIATPVELFADLQLGIFTRDSEYVLARWTQLLTPAEEHRTKR